MSAKAIEVKPVKLPLKDVKSAQKKIISISDKDTNDIALIYIEVFLPLSAKEINSIITNYLLVIESIAGAVESDIVQEFYKQNKNNPYLITVPAFINKFFNAEHQEITVKVLSAFLKETLPREEFDKMQKELKFLDSAETWSLPAIITTLVKNYKSCIIEDEAVKPLTPDVAYKAIVVLAGMITSTLYGLSAHNLLATSYQVALQTPYSDVSDFSDVVLKQNEKFSPAEMYKEEIIYDL